MWLEPPYTGHLVGPYVHSSTAIDLYNIATPYIIATWPEGDLSTEVPLVSVSR